MDDLGVPLFSETAIHLSINFDTTQNWIIEWSNRQLVQLPDFSTVFWPPENFRPQFSGRFSSEKSEMAGVFCCDVLVVTEYIPILFRKDTFDGRDPANHLGCIKPWKQWDIYHIN